MKKEFRFAIGTENSMRSSVWKFWTTGSELYIQSRMMGCSTKVSLHYPTYSQWSMESKWYGENRPRQPNVGRHINRWEREVPKHNEAAHVFRIVIPRSELRTINVDEDLAKVVWLPVPEEGCAANVECYITPPSDQKEFNFPYAHLATLDLTDDRYFVALTHEDKVSRHNENQLSLVRSEAVALAQADGDMVQPEFRGVAFFQDDNGVRGMIEFVPSGYKES
jgi:hypothetical protein